MLRLYLCSITLAAMVLAGCQTSRAPVGPAQAQLETSAWIRVDPPGAGTSKDLPSDAPSPRSGTELTIQTLGGDIPHRGSAPIAFTPPSSTVVVEDQAGQSDSYRDGSVTIPITMYRVIPDVQKALALGMLSPTAEVKFWVYDIDSYGRPCAERNVAYLNGERLGDLSGDNGKWTRHTFVIPTSTLRFPTAPGRTATNTFRMDIDVNGCNAWLAEVDYVQITFEAADPIVFVHGILSGSERWGELNDELTSRGYVTSDTINLEYEEFPASDLTSPGACREAQFQTVSENADDLRDQIQDALSDLGAERVHIVAHSKGGMDARAFISSLRADTLKARVGTVGGTPVEAPVEVVSLTTLNTPHAGSPVADLGVAYVLSENGLTDQDGEKLLKEMLNGSGGFVRGQVVTKLLSKNHVCDLTQNRARYYSRTNPVTVPILATGTDADPDGDGELEAGDLTGFESLRWVPDNVERWMAKGVVNQLYTFTGTTRTLTYGIDANGNFTVEKSDHENDAFVDNDVVVTKTSASDDGSFALSIEHVGINHNEIGVNEDTIDALINLATGGVLDWSERQ